ncbi:alanine dehydrogenase/PNT-like protein [Aquimarina intermedia]|uniref:Alanine dehydrogenase/PNT-like protein n=1 Tax=Aquimarina intermedia TaxID=350814 RepID=A0A5S5BVB6_9FLAO|nr:alanine dehydrogenase/PNT-like protein [Aquimarina intermedia]
MITFGIIKERKSPPDRRVVFSPQALAMAKKQFPNARFKVESSDIRVFSDQEYRDAGFEVTQDISDCDVLLGVKEVPKDALLANKKYFFFSHTIKKQPYNRELLLTILEKNIELFDHEVITDQQGMRLIGFGRYAGIVGAYNAMRTWGLKFGDFTLPKANELEDQSALINTLSQITLPAIKIVLTGKGKVGNGAKEMLDAMQLCEVSVHEFLNESFDEPVYVQLDVEDYVKTNDDQPIADKSHFYKNPEEYKNDFLRFTEVSDLFIAGHFYGEGAPVFYSKEDIASNSFKIKVVADISCDIDGPIATTIRSSTIADPVFGFDPQSGKEIDFKDPNAIAVMAVDNLPCELPKDASEGFGQMFLDHVLPAFFEADADGILERARMTQQGKLTKRYSYLKEYVDEAKAS